MKNYSEEQLVALRNAVRLEQPEKRFQHSLGVEAEAGAIAALYIPEKVGEMRAAGLLHDLTKAKTDEEQIALCRELGLPPDSDERLAPQVLHGRTAAALIPRLYPDFATPDILRAVRVHTTGTADMTLFDKILFLADYIEPGRHYPDCRAMRAAFWEVPDDILRTKTHLDDILRRVLAHTIDFLKKHGTYIVPETVAAYEWLADENETEMQTDE